jgi:hypothetical protein
VQHTIEVAVPTADTDTVVRELEQLDAVISLSVYRGASIKPPGDVVSVHALNHGTDDILRVVSRAQKHGSSSVTTSETQAIIDPEHQQAVDSDVDEASWEEMGSNLRHHARVTTNFLLLMAAGGAIAAMGLVSEPSTQAISFVAASAIAPGFEPFGKLALGLVLRRWQLVRQGLASAGAGYLALIASAALTFGLLRLVGSVSIPDLVDNPAVDLLVHPPTNQIIRTAVAAAAGMLIITAYRHTLLPGALMAMELIPAAALAGVGIATGSPSLVYEGLERLALDIAFVIGLGALILLVKQAFVHRRRPLV